MMRMNDRLKAKYRSGPDDSRSLNKPWRGGRGGLTGSSTSGTARSKGLNHPHGMTGRTIGKLIRAYKDR